MPLVTFIQTPEFKTEYPGQIEWSTIEWSDRVVFLTFIVVR